VSYVGIPVLMDDEERAQRMAAAILNSLDTWISQVEEIAANSIPITGNLRRALHLQHAMEQAKQSLKAIAGEE